MDTRMRTGFLGKTILLLLQLATLGWLYHAAGVEALGPALILCLLPWLGLPWFYPPADRPRPAQETASTTDNASTATKPS